MVQITEAEYERIQRYVETVEIIDRLRADEGATVTLMSDNADFNGHDNSAIEVCDAWTNWVPRRIEGSTVLAALRASEAAKAGT